MTEFQVTGMTCGHCEAAVRKAVLALDPGAEVVIDRPAGRVSVETGAAREAVAAAIAAEGYEVAGAPA
ncbi:MAG: heavy-metal-associated domain-containing protein [Rhodobacteraceae bacterium]|nr:heavy-metal-associated domain-containing protein [Paracoccaceae bacterium]